MQSNVEQGKPAMSADAFVNVSAAGSGSQQPPPSYTAPSVSAAYMVQPGVPAYAGGPSYVAPQYGAHMQYGGAPPAVGFAQPVGTQNVQVNMIGATAPPPQTIAIGQSTTVVKPQGYLGWSIFNLLCCFCPLGLAALMYSIKVGTARSVDEARGYAMTAQKLNIAATVIGIVVVAVIVGANCYNIYIVGAYQYTPATIRLTNTCYYYRSSYYGTYSYYC